MMRSVISAFAALILFVGGSLQAAEKPVKGSITKIEKDKGIVVLVVEVAARKKGDASAATEKKEKRYTLNSTTRVEKVTGKKDNQIRSEARIDDLKEGQKVTLSLTGEKVDKVEFVAGKKNK